MLVLPWVCDGRTGPSNVIGNALPPRLRNLHPPLTKTSRDRVSARSTSLVSPLHPGHPNKALLAFQLCFAELFAAHRHAPLSGCFFVAGYLPRIAIHALRVPRCGSYLAPLGSFHSVPLSAFRSQKESRPFIIPDAFFTFADRDSRQWRGWTLGDNDRAVRGKRFTRGITGRHRDDHGLPARKAVDDHRAIKLGRLVTIRCSYC
jgi:hypothetical protein